MNKNIYSLHHCSFIVSDIDKALKFYRDVLGLDPSHNRPDLGYPGAWLDVGEQQIHLMELMNPDPSDNRPEHGGRDRHIALRVKSLDVIEDRFKKHGCLYTSSKSGRRAVFCRDPDGNTIELIES